MKTEFVHLHLHTTYSILDGMIKIEDLINKVKEEGMPAVAITDHGSISGAINFYEKAIENGIKPIIGAELYITNDRHIKSKAKLEQEDLKYTGYHLLLLAKDIEGYKNLCKLITIGYTEGFYYKPRIDKEVLSKYNKGLIMLSSCLAGEIPQAILKDDEKKLKESLDYYLSIFGQENFYVELQYHNIQEQRKVNTKLIQLAKKLNLKRVITNDAHYLLKEHANPHDILLCIQTKKRVDDPNRLKFKTNEFYLKNYEELYSIWGSDFKDAFLNTLEISEKINLELKLNSIYYLPKYTIDNKEIDSFVFLKKLCLENLPKKYPNYDQNILDRMEYELKVINDMGFSDYFLIVWDFINWAKSRGIPVGPGRGSVGGSLVAYLIGITNIDPLKYGLLFERFLNPGRKSLPDIDTDFCQLRRDEVIEYITEKYGKSKVAHIGTFGTLKAKAAIRDAARVLGYPASFGDYLAKMIPFNYSIKEALNENKELQKEYYENKDVKKVIDIAIEIEGVIRNQSVHAAGVVISSIDLDELTPLIKQNDVIATAYDMSSIEKLGLVKMDFLGLRTLSVTDDTVKLIKKINNIDIDIYNLDLEDKKVYELLSNGQTVGVFQLESKGMQRLLKELKPSNIYEIISAIALYRPGPLESGLVKQFIESKHDKSKINYLHPDLEEILKETYGVIVYQEQIMQIAVKFANFTLAQADDLRKAMGKKKPEIMEKYKEIFIKGCIENGYDEQLARTLFDIIEKFAGYGFNKSHSAAYGLITYITAYLKAHYPHEFLASLLKSVENNPDKLKVFLNEAIELNIKVLPPDINKSEENFTVEISNNEKYIRYGLLGIKGLGQAAINEIISKRSKKPFTDIQDFILRVNTQVINKKSLEVLILSGCFDSLHPNRLELYKNIDTILNLAKNKSNALFSITKNKDNKINDLQSNDNQNKLLEILKLERETLGIYLSNHPVNIIQKNINIKLPSISKVKKSYLEREESLIDNNEVTLIGVINELKESYTKKGKMAIFILDDPSDFIETIVYPEAYQNYKNYLKENEVIIVKGKLELEKLNEKEEEIDEEENFKLIVKEIYSFKDFINKINFLNNNNNSNSEIKINSINKIDPFLNLSIFIEFNPNIINNNIKNLRDFLNLIRNLSVSYEDINKINSNGNEYISFTIEIFNNDKYNKIQTNKYISKDSIEMIKSLANSLNLESINILLELNNN
ncbi:MAG: DNA polymerase III subunit alpha [bacterium]